MTATPLTGELGRAALRDYPRPGETSTRHLTSLKRKPVVLDAGRIVPHPPAELPAIPIELSDLDDAIRLIDDAPTAARTAARNAITGRWRYALHYGCGRALGRPEVESESVVLRAAIARPFPWRIRRIVAVWRRTGGAGSWSFEVAYRWELEAGAVLKRPERLAAGELAWWLKTSGEQTANPRPPKKKTVARAA